MKVFSPSCSTLLKATEAAKVIVNKSYGDLYQCNEQYARLELNKNVIKKTLTLIGMSSENKKNARV